MGFIEEIKRSFCLDQGIAEPVYRAVIFGDGGAYVENVKAIIKYSCEEVLLSLKSGGLKISGSELYIKKYCAGDVVVCGKITTIQRT